MDASLQHRIICVIIAIQLKAREVEMVLVCETKHSEWSRGLRTVRCRILSLPCYMSTGLTMKKTVLTCLVNKVGSFLYPVTYTLYIP